MTYTSFNLVTQKKKQGYMAVRPYLRIQRLQVTKRKGTPFLRFPVVSFYQGI